MKQIGFLTCFLTQERVPAD